MLVDDAGKQIALPRHVGAMIDDARNLALVHRIDHRSRGATPAERFAQARHFVERQAVAAEFARDHRREQAFAAHRFACFVREARLAVDGVGMGGRDRGDAACGREQGGCVARRRGIGVAV